MNITFAIAGASYREGAVEVITALKPGQKYRLTLEPSNPHDPNAIQVWVDEYSFGRAGPKSYHLGYVPRKWSGTVALAIKHNRLHVWATKPDASWGSVCVKWVDVTADPL